MSLRRWKKKEREEGGLGIVSSYRKERKYNLWVFVEA
jgi:hypothetical protein